MIKREKSKKVKRGVLTILSLFLITLSLVLFIFKYYPIYKNKQTEKTEIKNFFNIQKKYNIALASSQKEVSEIDNTDSYIGIIEIPKIGLKKGFYSIKSNKNNVDINIEVLKESTMPDVLNGNLILASHSGNSRISYFRRLSEIRIDDYASIYFHGKKYSYKLVNRYDIPKTGKAIISRNGFKSTLTLITCKQKFNEQTIFIFELEEEEDI